MTVFLSVKIGVERVGRPEISRVNNMSRKLSVSSDVDSEWIAENVDSVLG